MTAVHAYPHPPDKFFANLANAAVYVVRRDALRPFSRNSEKLDLTKDILCRLVAAGSRVLAYRSSEYIKDMGTPARLQRVEADWQAGKISLEQSGQKRPTVFLIVTELSMSRRAICGNQKTWRCFPALAKH